MTELPDMPAKPVQTQFLDLVSLSGCEVAIYLLNGVKLHGRVLRHDRHALLLATGAHVQLVGKVAISTVVPEGPNEPSRPVGTRAKRT